MLDKEKIEKIDEILEKRYNDKFSKFGISPKSLGWGTNEHQLARFNIALDSVDFSNKSVLDIGCGLSDFYKHIKEKNINIKSYKGIEITNKFIEINKKSFPKNEYEIRDILLRPFEKPVADIGVMFGLVNFNFKENMNNLDYTKEFIEKALSCVNECLIIDMLSENIDGDYPKEDFVFYYNPEEMMKFCLKLTNNVILRHDYNPIPQKEFMLILKKKNE